MKSLGKNALFNVIYKCFNILFPLLTTAYVSRILLPIGIGKVAAAQNIVSYFVIIAALGLPVYGVKKISECSDNRLLCSKTFFELFSINAISTCICSLVYIITVLLLGYFENKYLLSFIVGIQLFANIFNIDWFYQGIEEYKYIMYRSLFVKCIALLSVFAFVHNEGDFIIYALISTLSLVVNYLFNIYHLKKYISISINKIDLKSHIKPVIILLATSLAIEVYTLADTTMLNILKNDTSVGYYTNSTKVISLIRMLITAICAVYLPRLNYFYSQGSMSKFTQLAKEGLYTLVTIALPAAIGFFLLSDVCVLLVFGLNFEPSIITMRILSISIFTVAISNFIGYQVLITLGKERVVLFSTIFGAILNVLLNLILINRFAQNGAAIASVITEFFIAVYQYFVVIKYVQIKTSCRHLVTFLIPLIALTFIILLVKQFIDIFFLQIILSGILGLIVYVFLSYKLENAIVVKLVNQIYNRL